MAAARPLALALCVVLLGGCGQRDEDDDRAARAAADTFLELCARGAGEELLPVLAAPARRVVIEAPSPREGCAAIAKLPETTASELGRLFAEARVDRVEVRGDTGTVHLAFPGGLSSELDAEATGTSRWLLTNAPLP